MAHKVYIVGDSRVSRLSPASISPKVVKCWSKPGATFYDLYDTIDNEFINAQTSTRHTKKPLIYIIAGICNTTQIVRGRINGAKHEELIVKVDQAENCISDTMSAIEDLQNFVIRHEAIPIFSTIYPSSLTDWNHKRLNQGKTCILRFADQYPEMQETLEHQIESVNQYIIETNRKLNLKTPQIHKCMHHNRGPNRANKFNYTMLIDGCHPSNSLINKTHQCLKRNISLNATSD